MVTSKSAVVKTEGCLFGVWWMQPDGQSFWFVRDTHANLLLRSGKSAGGVPGNDGLSDFKEAFQIQVGRYA